MTRSNLSLQLSERSGVPFYRQLVEQLTDLIRSGQLAPGALLPSVRGLSGELLVSLITVRRAYEELESAGLLERRQGQGTFVAERVAAPNAADREEVRQSIVLAVERARTLGMSEGAIREAVEEALGRGDAAAAS